MARLGDVCEIVTGSTPKSGCPEYWNGDINWVTPAELTDDTDVIYETQRKITRQAVIDSSLKPFPCGTVLLSSRAPIGKVTIAGTEMYCNQGFKNLICSDKIYNRYLFHFLRSKTQYLNSLGRGATFKEISKSIVADIEIPLPTLEEQRKIAVVLDKISDLTAKRRRQLDKLDELVKSRFVEMFGDFGNQGEKITLADVCKIITDGTHQPPEFVPSGIPFLFVSNIVTNEITYDAEKFISEDTYNELIKRTPIELGDILLSTVGSYGHPAIVKSDKRFCFQRHIAYLKPKAELVDSVYLHSAILSDDVQRQIEKNVKGIAQKTLNLSEIRKIKVPLPSMESQKRFAEMVTHIDKIKLQVRASLDKLEMLKKARMQEYFR